MILTRRNYTGWSSKNGHHHLFVRQAKMDEANRAADRGAVQIVWPPAPQNRRENLLALSIWLFPSGSRHMRRDIKLILK
jgi:hypothetical protein